jgi:hypothetical protein
MTSLWRKKKNCDKLAPTIVANDGHNEQKQDILTYPLDILHEENVRLGLYDGVYDLSIKSEDLSIKSWVGLTDEEISDMFCVMGTADADINLIKLLTDARRIEAKLKEKNT